jgi:hypothetical protein
MRNWILAALFIAGFAGPQPVPDGTHFSDKSTGPRESIRELVKDDASWKSVWGKLTRGVRPAKPAPAVDFARQMVVVVSQGQRANDCYDIQIIEVKDTPSCLEVEVRQAFPLDNSGCGDMLCYPWDAVVLHKSEKEVRFTDAR